IGIILVGGRSSCDCERAAKQEKHRRLVIWRSVRYCRRHTIVFTAVPALARWWAPSYRCWLCCRQYLYLSLLCCFLVMRPPLYCCSRCYSSSCFSGVCSSSACFCWS
ncbi:unnamed protein product, partial [Laminaria digitata]